jgi:hypothetical protein
VHAHAPAARRLAEDGDVAWVAAERGDVAADPLERRDLVLDPVVARTRMGRVLRGERAVGEEAEGTEG